MNIGLDYDGTITEDLVAWREFCKLFKSMGHKIWIVTMRFPEEVFEAQTHHALDRYIEGVIYTQRKAKKPFVEELGIKIDVWIDDNPNAVHLDAKHIWKTVFPTGQTS